MENLSLNWITEKNTDFEYKKYSLLAYLENAKAKLQANILYPTVTQLTHNLQMLINLKNTFLNLDLALSKEVKNIDLQSCKINYQSFILGDKLSTDLLSIIDYSIVEINPVVQYANHLVHENLSKIKIDTIGLNPLNKHEGYLFFNNGNPNDILIYYYQLSLYDQSNADTSCIKTQFIDYYKQSITMTIDNMKLDLIKKYKEIPNPATYLFSSSQYLPLEYTFIPLANKKLIQALHTG
ncbi:MAG: hypothetical protein IT238_07760 [Bacteroidia bacterium]|nr:hypothetical protein [Bacteroidia bacterium]MCZ2249955.1 hypothetical protein [Bacteroidia bacterium]